MIQNIKRKMRKDEEEGFTLIELLVVVLILGILMAIAIPTFLSLTGGAKKSAAEADLTTAAQDEAVYLTTNGVFDTTAADTTPAAWSAANVTAMIAADAGINWVAAAPGAAGTKSVSVAVTVNATTPTLWLETVGSDGNTYWVKDTAGTLTYAISTKAVGSFTYPAVTASAQASSWNGVTVGST